MMKEVDPKGTSRAYAFGMWMDGAHAARFLERLQKEISGLKAQSVQASEKP